MGEYMLSVCRGVSRRLRGNISCCFAALRPNGQLGMIAQVWRASQWPCFAGSNFLFKQVPLIRLQLTRKSKSGLSDSLNSLRILPDSNLAENALRYIFSKNSNPGAP